MKKNFITCVSFLSIMSLFSCSSEKEFNRWGDKLTQYVVEEYMPAKDYIWNWNEAVFLKSAVVRCENNIDKGYLFPYIQTAVDSTFGDANGHHPNAVISGLGLAYLAQTTGESRYKDKAYEIFEQYKNIPRATNGGVSHREEVIELWDDTVYMVGEFLMQMYKLTGNKEFLLEAISQLKSMRRNWKIRKPVSGITVGTMIQFLRRTLAANPVGRKIPTAETMSSGDAAMVGF